MDSREALRQRVELATRQQARTHGHYFEDTLAVLTELFGAELSAAVRACSTPPPDPAPFNYLVEHILRLCGEGANLAELREGVPYSEALERIGAGVGRAFLRSLVGKAFWRFPERDMHELLEWSVASARASTSYGERRYEKLGPTSGRLVLRGDLMGPSWILGFYRETLPLVSARALSVVVRDCQEPGVNFSLHISW